MLDRVLRRRRSAPTVGDDGLTAAERRRLAASYQAGPAARPTSAQQDDLRAKLCTRDENRPAPRP